MILRKVVVLFCCFWSFTVVGQTNIKAMFYNLLNYDNDFESRSKTPYLKSIIESVEPDLFMVCELRSETASNYMFDNALVNHNPDFKKAPYRNSESPATSLLQMVYYNSSKLILESTNVIPTITRDINHYTFVVNSKNSQQNPIKMEVFVTHLKASRGAQNRQKRLASIENFVWELEKLPKNSNIIFAGDFNFYTSNEEGFLKLIDEVNSIKIIDPINRLCPTFPNDGKDYFDEDFDATYFWNNSTFADVHSQSTRSSSLSDGSGGGMDDRFDFIMISENLKDNNPITYKPHSYKTIGNNGNCYNSFVSNSSCSGEYSQNLRNALFNFSDHLPITIDLEVTSTLSIKNLSSFKIVNSNLVQNNLTLEIKNSHINQIHIYNQLGQKLKTVFLNNQKQLTVNLESFSKGVYYISANSLKPKKFIKI